METKTLIKLVTGTTIAGTAITLSNTDFNFDNYTLDLINNTLYSALNNIIDISKEVYSNLDTPRDKIGATGYSIAGLGAISSLGIGYSKLIDLIAKPFEKKKDYSFSLK